MDLQERIKNIGVKKQYLANRIGLSPSMFSHWLAGRVIITSYQINKLEEIIQDIEKTLNIKH